MAPGLLRAVQHVREQSFLPLSRQVALALFDAFEAQTILDAVDAGTAPRSWKVYRATKPYFVWQGLLITFAGIVISLLGAASYALGVTALVGLQAEGSAWFLSLVGIIIGLVATGFSIGCFWSCIILFRQISSAPSQIIVLTPEGFVVRTGPQPKLPPGNNAFAFVATPWTGTKGGIIYAVPYATMVSTELYTWNTRSDAHINLIMTFVAPRSIVFWRADPRFLYCDSIAQRILEAHVRYEAQHADAR